MAIRGSSPSPTQFTSIAPGIVPASGGGSSKYLRADQTWDVPPSGSGTVTNVSGTAPVTITNPTTTPVVAVSAATATASGLVPTPPNSTTEFLRGDATWAVPPGGSSALTLIAQVVTSGNQTSVNFTSIPSSYTSLMVKCLGKSNKNGTPTGDPLIAQFNGDSSSGNYYSQSARACNLNYSTVVPSSTYYSGAMVGVFTLDNVGISPPSQFASSVNIEIIGYSQTTFAKNTLSTSSFQEGNGFSHASSLDMEAAQWNNTAAINSITLVLSSGSSFANGSIFTLYGVS